MTDALYIYLRGEQALDSLPSHLAERARRQWAVYAQQTTLLDRELKFCKDHNIQVLCYGDEAYPQRLQVCKDAPLVLFYLGNAPLNARHVISIVGTRHLSPYGRDLCERITADLGRLLPDALVVSGLAYGADINAHRGALANHLSTVAVVAHGLDRIYPYTHKETAAQMTRQGGLLTEYPMGTEPERYNFVHRNRIVAALADCTIVIESARRGGSMITAERVREFGRPVLACPGRLTDATSEGCNRAIAEGKAFAFTDVEDLIIRMGWESTGSLDAVQQSLFAEGLTLSPEEQQLISVLRGTEGMTADQLSSATSMPAFQVGAILTDLEMQGLLALMPGGVYRLRQSV